MPYLNALSGVHPSEKLREQFDATLFPTDRVMLLPGFGMSPESGTLKNTVLWLDGSVPRTEKILPLFSGNWFSGVSAVVVSTEAAERVLASEKERTRFTEYLKRSVPTEYIDVDLEVGPSLDGDEHGRDCSRWTAGFDSASGCCIGLYAAMVPFTPVGAPHGMSRHEKKYYLVCKAGAGLSASVFHSRLAAGLRNGASIDQLLHCDTPGTEDEPAIGSACLKRLASSASRNRRRLLAVAATGLDSTNRAGVNCIRDVWEADASSVCSMPLAVCEIDVTYNALRRECNHGGGAATWVYTASCVDSNLSTGLLSACSATMGFEMRYVPFMDTNEIVVTGDSGGCMPFASQRACTTYEVFKTVLARLENRTSSTLTAGGATQNGCKLVSPLHNDEDFVRKTFAWHTAESASLSVDVDMHPPVLWGTHERLAWHSRWDEELGVEDLHCASLIPELVCISGFDAHRLKAAHRHVFPRKAR